MILATGIAFTMAIVAVMTFSACKKEKTDDDSKPADDPKKKEYVLMINNGAQTILPNESIAYTAVLIDNEGNVSTPNNVSWSTSSNTVATISASGVITAAGVGDVKITASVTVDGKTYTASVPLGIYAVSVFSVAPSAILYEKGGSLQLEAIHLSTTGAVTPTCTYESSNTAIATVNASGLVSFVAAGECVITVTATSLQGNPQVKVPVIVIGAPTVSLPITKIIVNPPAKDLFRNETQQLTAKAYKSDGTEASASFTWTSLDPAIATVNSTGLVQPVNPGNTYIQASANGIIGQAEIIVNPDTIVWVDPFYVSVAAGKSRQFTATAYKITRTTATPISGMAFNWMIPTYGIAIFDIATVTSSGLVTVKSEAMPGMMTFVAAEVQGNPNLGGVGSIMVGIADNCDCGNGNSQVHHITINNSAPINMNLMAGTPVQLNAVAYNSSNAVVSSPALVYCSDNITVASVDADGQIMAVGEGTAIIKVCSGPYAEATITVNVTLMK